MGVVVEGPRPGVRPPPGADPPPPPPPAVGPPPASTSPDDAVAVPAEPPPPLPATGTTAAFCAAGSPTVTRSTGAAEVCPGQASKATMALVSTSTASEQTTRIAVVPKLEM